MAAGVKMLWLWRECLEEERGRERATYKGKTRLGVAGTAVVGVTGTESARTSS